MIAKPAMWDVRIVEWELYRDTLVNTDQGSFEEKQLWLQLVGKTDLIVGGLDFGGDFL